MPGRSTNLGKVSSVNQAAQRVFLSGARPEPERGQDAADAASTEATSAGVRLELRKDGGDLRVHGRSDC